jgi:hypothetical protein
MLIHPRMMLELKSEVSGRSYLVRPQTLGKVLHLARLEGWEPGRLLNQCPSDSWDTAIILPDFGPYMPGKISRADANGLRIALTRALATGTVAAEGTVQTAAGTLLQLAREGAFRVQLETSESSSEPQPFAGAVPA